MVGQVAISERRKHILKQITFEVADLLGFDDADQLDVNGSLLEMGAESVVMMEAVGRIRKKYGIQIAMRQFFEELTTLDSLASYIDQNLSPEWEEGELKSPLEKETSILEQAVQPQQQYLAQPQQQYVQPQQQYVQPQQQYVQPQQQYSEINPTDDGSIQVADTALERIMEQQLKVISQQLELFRGNLPQAITNNNSISQVTPHQGEVLLPNQRNVPSNGTSNGTSNGKTANGSGQNIIKEHPSSVSELQKPAGVKSSSKRKQISSPAEIRKPRTGGLNEEQKRHLEALSVRYTKRTQSSKKLVQQARPVLADSRASIGFRPAIKEMLYPIVAKRSQGARVWDVDGNEYVDLTMGQGVLLFGHQPPFIMEAIKEQMELGIQLHPRHHLVGEVAELICELTGMERVCFSNSGTEAVLTAIRLARAASGRSKIVIFEGCYHGHGDTTLIGKDIFEEGYRSVPMAPGIPNSTASDVIVLDYGIAKSLEYIQDHADEIAAVLTEPVQSNRPKLQPKEFLHSLRKITEERGIILIFDEISTGFRTHPGGFQALFEVKADIATYGKVVGGGFPIGIIAGKSRYLDHIDGGMWNYGDKSFPQVERTFFGGTFCMHPFAMVATRAVLKRMKEEGPSLQEGLTQKTTNLANRLNTYFEENEIPIEVEHFSSFFRFQFSRNLDPFFYHLLDKGVYVWEWRKYFISTAHTDEDIEYVIEAVKETIQDMRSGGFFVDSKLKSLTPQTDSKKNNEQKIESASAKISTPKKQEGSWVKRSFGPIDDRSMTDGVNGSYCQKQVQFSLYYFGNYKSEFSPDKYNLLFEGAKFGDEHGFAAIWIPERHFHKFGGFSPNPSVISAALAKETKQIKLRAGSVVLPLHHPVRVAEEWSVVDNISKGRVGIAFASGWHENDFVFSPDVYGNHREVMFQNINTVQSLWRGESVQVKNGSGKEIDVNIFPTPMQLELPIWITIVNNPDTYRRAGEIGAGVLTNLMGQKIEDLAKNMQIYRQSLSQHGHDPRSGHVTVLLHTLMGKNLEESREKGRQPMYDYMTSSMQLFKSTIESQGLSMDIDGMTEDDRQVVLESAYKRYVETSALIGTPESCIPIVERLMAIGVDEIACLIDFGPEENEVIESLPYINQLKQHFADRVIKVPLTESQKQLWFLDKLGKNSALAYIDSFYAQLEGVLHVEVMEQALQGVVDRHEALRTRIGGEGEFQEVLPSVKIEVPVIDFSNSPENTREAKVAEWIEQTFQEPFNLSEAPLFQIYILKLEQELHRLVVKVHHIITDGWSTAILLHELSSLYSALCQGQICQFKQAMQFREYVDWQNKQLQTAEMAAHESYWVERFSESIPALNLPADRPHPALMSYKGSKQSLRIDASLANKIKKVGKQKGCTLFMLLLAAYKVLLHRLSGEKEIVVGIPTVGRPLEGSEKLVGYCVHLLPIKTSFQESEKFSEYLKEMRGVLLDAYEHQDYPFANLLNKLDLHRDFSRPILISAAFNLDLPLGMPKMSGLSTSLMSPPKIPLAYDIYLTVTDIDGDLLLDCGYNREIFDDETISRWLHHYRTLLEAIAVNPETPVTELPLLTAADWQQLLRQGNERKHDYQQDRCLQQLFEEQCLGTPEAIAVVCAGQQLSYGQLNQRANQLAYYLQTLGVGPDVLVGLCVERSLDMIVGLLGIMKAGAAYLPLDPQYPTERLAYMLADAAAPVLLTQQSLRELWSQVPIQVVCLDSDWQAIAQHSGENPDSGVKPGNLAYGIYTSGSTGQPKGVAIEHRSIVNYVCNIIDRFGFQSHNKYALLSTISADLGNTVIFPSLCTGGQLHVLPWDTTVDSNAFIRYMLKQEIEYIKVVPSHLAALQNPAQPAQVLPRKGLILGGEASQLDWVQGFFGETSSCKIYNHYGPAETTVGVLTYKVENPLPETQTLPLGMPLNNVEIYILDGQLNPVPIGVPGELYVGGMGVSRGYLNRPDWTAEKFIPNPYGSDAGGRLYRTGDLARYLPDGNISFMGRVDHQVKISGFRVELKDVEAVISQHPDVREVTVMVRENEGLSNKQLVGYVVPTRERNPLIAGMTRYKLPNNLAVAHLNKNETDYIYREIFELQAYLRHGITINPGDCIFDVGANIGLFTVFSALIGENVKIYAFEPNPTVFEICRANASLYAENPQVFNCGLAAQRKTAEFTFFPGFSLLSGFYADAETERDVVKQFVSNQGQNGDAAAVQDFLSQADEILSERFQGEKFTAQLRTISEIIASEGIERIDLLKINVEKSELDVLSGIQEQDWGKISQIVLEVDIKENIDPIASLLKRHGYDLVVAQDVLLANTELCYIYAIHPDRGSLIREQDPQAHIKQFPAISDPIISADELKAFLQDKLPEYMIPNAFAFLESIPLTANGKVDRQALPDPEKQAGSQATYVAPETETEKIVAEILQEVLQIDKVGSDDNFFELGGSSLLLIHANRKAQEKMAIEIPIVDWFTYPTVKSLSQHISGLSGQDDGEKEKMRTETRAQGKEKMKQRRQQRHRER